MKLTNSVRTSDGWLADLYGRPLRLEGARYAPVAFGDDLKADLYYPTSASGKLPLVVWLHSFSYATGYSRYGKPAIQKLVSAGYAVLAFDQIGFGTRIHQARNFYKRYPKWSLMGKMVTDTKAVIDAASSLAKIDAARIYLAGTGMGSRIALYTLIGEPRVAGAILMGGLSEFRAATGGEGLRQLSHLHGLMPRLGFFIGQESRLPVDDPDVLALAAPRRILIVAPEVDRYSRVDSIRSMAERLRPQFGVSLDLLTPRDFHRFPPSTIDQVIAWLGRK